MAVSLGRYPHEGKQERIARDKRQYWFDKLKGSLAQWRPRNRQDNYGSIASCSVQLFGQLIQRERCEKQKRSWVAGKWFFQFGPGQESAAHLDHNGRG